MQSVQAIQRTCSAFSSSVECRRKNLGPLGKDDQVSLLMGSHEDKVLEFVHVERCVGVGCGMRSGWMGCELAYGYPDHPVCRCAFFRLVVRLARQHRLVSWSTFHCARKVSGTIIRRTQPLAIMTSPKSGTVVPRTARSSRELDTSVSGLSEPKIQQLRGTPSDTTGRREKSTREEAGLHM